MESFPFESMEVNITGTKQMADISGEYGVSHFINLSSNVAVNPASLMGASKRIGEMYLEALAQTKKYSTRFVSVRFGNLASPGSPVVQLLEKQIGQGGPVTKLITPVNGFSHIFSCINVAKASPNDFHTTLLAEALVKLTGLVLFTPHSSPLPGSAAKLPAPALARQKNR